MTITSLSASPGPLHLLLEPVIRTDLDRIDIRSHQSVLEIGATTGEITARLAQLVGCYGSVNAVDHDTSQLTVRTGPGLLPADVRPAPHQRGT